MNYRRKINPTIWIVLAFLLGLVVRLLLLGSMPLDDTEAGWALQALHIARGNSVEIGANPGYVLLTAFLFEIFSSSNWLARLIPALAGSALILAPLFLRKKVGDLPAILLAFALAFDPGLLALSRQAGGTMIAVAMGVLALSVWLDGRYRLAGVFAGLAFLGGMAIWPGLIGAALAVVLFGWVLVEPKAETQADEQTRSETGFSEIPGREGRVGVFDATPAEGMDDTVQALRGVENRATEVWTPTRKMLAFGLGTFLVVGTLFLRYPQGLSAVGSSLAAYLRSWTQPSATPSNWWLLTLVFYHPIPLIFGLIGIVRGWVSGLRLERWLSLWTALALIIALLNPAQQPSDLIWVLIPLWAVTVLEITRALQVERIDLYPALGQGGITLVLLTFTGLILYALVVNIEGNTTYVPFYKFAFLGGIVLVFASAFLIAWGWYYTAALHGVAWGSLIVLSAYTLSAASQAGGYRALPTAELWRSGQTMRQVNLVVDTLEQFSQWDFTRRDAIDVVTAGVNAPALEWALRDFSSTSYVNFVDSSQTPSVVITGLEAEPSLAAGYSGQDFVLSEAPDWSSLTPFQWLEWLTFRKAPASSQSLIVWGRTDLFTAAKQSNSTVSP